MPLARAFSERLRRATFTAYIFLYELALGVVRGARRVASWEKTRLQVIPNCNQYPENWYTLESFQSPLLALTSTSNKAKPLQASQAAPS